MIPKILHRTLPAVPRDDVAELWATVVRHTPGWDRRTYQSPRDPADWPLVGHLLPLCRDRAEDSDLVRLEALWTHGGVYVDSDVELTRPLDWVLNLDCVIGWESDEWFGTAFMAAAPQHPAIGLLLEVFTAHVGSQGERSTLPKIATKTWRDRQDVTVLPRKAVYPYSWLDVGTGIDMLDWAADPDVLAIHRWHGSWVKG
jgi:hypothetical protein